MFAPTHPPTAPPTLAKIQSKTTFGAFGTHYGTQSALIQWTPPPPSSPSWQTPTGEGQFSRNSPLL